MGNLLWLIIIVLVILWLGGFSFHIGGSLIHVLLVIALILLIVRLATGRRVI
ncbi:MAG TPA: lmo0937 family membrane protein [Thermoanaerobaculia bacterium]|nr:lmo0937 family membrane protein [Thermoanaerobaculia bacterium]